MPDSVITSMARQDLKGTGRHTRERWGAARCDAYLRDLDGRAGRGDDRPAREGGADGVDEGGRHPREDGGRG